MSERKVLNKYYPPEFDPSKIPKLKQSKNRTFSIRIMAPFNMRCNTCGEYIYKGKKFNSRKENVDNEDYLGLRIFRFYIKCPRCVAEIAFKTDLANTDYALEAGATRLFEAEKLAHQMAEKERKEKEEDELNPMKVLENRTKASRNEMEQLDQLEELREMNARHARVKYEEMLNQHVEYEEQLLKLQEEEEDRLVQEIMRKGASGHTIKRIQDDDSDEETAAKKTKIEKMISAKPTDVLADGPVDEKEKKKESWECSVGSFSNKTSLAGLVKKRAVPKQQSPGLSLASTTLQDCLPVKLEPEIDQIKEEIGLTACYTVASGNKPQSSAVSNSGTKTGSSTGLGMLGQYSDSDDVEDSE
uniref:Splicing factor YJU2 n=1 Tax=Arion vulgaris TaxID=1028688 RepID=A0A0B7BU91_9EUPU